MAAALDARYPGWHGLVAAGRTDTGVHALCQVVSVHVTGGAPVASAAAALNTALPDDVVVLDAAEAPDGFHARHSARARCLPVPRPRGAGAERARRAAGAAPSAGAVDRAVLDAWAAAVVGTPRRSRRSRRPRRSTATFVRSVHHAAWADAGDELHFTIAADELPAPQVRALVGTMLAVGARRAGIRTGRAAGRGAAQRRRPDGAARTGCTSRASGSTATSRARSLWESTKEQCPARRYGARKP